MKVVFAGLLALAGAASALAQPSPTDGLSWLRRMAYAARDLNYTGTFVYQHGNQVETSRITHLGDADGEHEKLEALDGPLREIIRDNDRVMCFFPGSKTVRVETRTARRNFPALLPDQLAGLADNYAIKTGRQERVAGFDCQLIMLQPKDNFRYGHRFCAENGTGLLLRAWMFGDKNEILEHFAFTQLLLGGSIDKDLVKSRYNIKNGDWKIYRASAPDPGTANSGWVVSHPPPGFKKTMEMRRTLGERPTPIVHLVYSDGIAAVSVFIEPLKRGATVLPGLSQEGAVSVFVKGHGDHRVTVLGETPPATVVQIGNSVAYSK